MPTLNQHTERAQRARANGAKSNGPKTPKGMQRSQSASYKHGLYATRGHMLPGESNDEFLELKAQQYAYWQPCFCQLQLAHFDALPWPTLGVNSSPWGRLEPGPAAPGGRRV